MRTLPESRRAHPRLGWLYKAGAAAALLSALQLLTAAIALVASLVQSSPTVGWLSSMAALWLIVIFKLHSGFSGIDIGQLTGFNLVDLAILALTAVMHVALYALLRKTSRVWAMVAAIQPLLGIALFLATANAGRSAVMGSALVASLIMLRGGNVRKAVACTGIAASLLLLAGDFTAGVLPPSTLIASLFAAGYALLTAWSFILGHWLWHRQA
jgi:hypothetical protein